jgi:plastocyanin
VRLPALLLVAVLVAPSVAMAGSIAGRVVFRGAVSSGPPIPVGKEHVAACGEAVPSESLIVSPATRGVKYAVVFVEGVTRASEAAPAEATLQNRNCRFEPHVLAVQVGAELSVVNADPVLHNLRAWAEGHRHVFNVVQPTRGQVTRRTIKKSGVITLTCDAHVHMSGYLVAFDHPHFAVTDDDGAFQIDGVPGGTYRVSAWHEGWTNVGREPNGRAVYDAPRLLSQDVTVQDTGVVRLTFELTGSR